MLNGKKLKKTSKKEWHIFDASKEKFGRLSSKTAVLLRGKHKIDFAPHLDNGDYVVIINSNNLKFTKGKDKNKIYYRFSGYPGGISAINLGDLIKKDSREVIKKAVFGMLPKNKLRNDMMKRLKIYKDDRHPYNDKFSK